MLVGRADLLRRCGALLVEAREGRPGVLCVVGEPGTGKSALLDEVVRAAAGTSVLRAAGVPGEQSLAFGALSLLLSGLDLAELPPRPRRSLEAALGRADGPVERLAVGVAFHELLGTRSVARPLLLVVDDVQWVDADTLQVLRFGLRRLAGQRVVALLAGRAGDGPGGGGLPAPIELGPLDDDDARELLRRRAPDLNDDVGALLVRRSGGNPLVLLEALARLTGHQRRGDQPLGPSGPLPEAVTGAFRERVEALPPGARDALLLLGAEGRGEEGLLDRVAAPGALEVLRRTGLIWRDGGRLLLRHPLLQAAALDLAAPEALREAHARLAAALGPAEPDRELWHRALSVVGPDASVAVELAALGRRRSRQGAPAAAAEALERAAALLPEPSAAAALLAEAASAALDAGVAPLALDLVGRAERASAGSPAALSVRARLARLRGHHEEAAELLGVAAGALDGAARYDVLVQRWWAAQEAQLGDVLQHTLGLLAGCPEAPPALLDTARAVLDADPTRAAPDGSERVALLALLARPVPVDAPVELVRLLATAANNAGDLSRSETLELRVGRALRLRGDAVGSAEAVNRAAFLAFHLGRWTTTEARLVEIEQLVAEDFAPVVTADALVLRAELAAAQGRSEPCREHCRRLRALAERLGNRSYAVLADRREALFELGAQRWLAALALLERAAGELERAGAWHPFLSPAAELVEVLVRLERPADAAAAAERFLSGSGAGAPPQVRARALRIRGLLAAPGQADELFRESAQLDGRVGLLFLQARTQLCHGERLRRERHRSAAQQVLSEAATSFERLGAAPWYARAAAELAACGGPVGGRDRVVAPLATQLTPQELQIAVAVSEGKRNREISAALFLSVRTVEFHLSSVYRKLEVTGRTQLVARMARA